MVYKVYYKGKSTNNRFQQYSRKSHARKGTAIREMNEQKKKYGKKKWHQADKPVYLVRKFRESRKGFGLKPFGFRF